MEFIVLKDETKIEVQSGATLNSIVTLLDNYASFETLAKSLSGENLSEVKFMIDEKTKGKYEKMTLKTPNFFVTKLETGKIQVVFGLRKKTNEELYVDDIQIAIAYLTDEQAVMVTELYPAWKENTQYNIGERIKYDGILYKCIQDHISQTDWTPKLTPSLFAKILTSENEEILEWEQPDSTNPYAKGDKVKHEDKTWVSDVDDNVWEPGVFGWTVIEEE